MKTIGAARSAAGRRILGACLGTALAALSLGAAAQIDTAPAVGLRDATPRVHALTGAKLYVGPGNAIESGTLVLRDGRVVAAGSDVAIPADAKVWALEGRVVYPGFIDAMTEIGLPDALRSREPRAEDEPPEDGPGAPPAEPAAAPSSSTGYWNPEVRPEIDVAAELALDAEQIKTFRELGITAALAVPRRGVLRGQSALVALADARNAREAVIATRVAQHAGTELARTNGIYPSSIMGVVALLRQSLYDAQWYQAMQAYHASNPGAERAAPISALAALEPLVERRQPLVYATEDELDYARALALAAEFDLDLTLSGNGHEYRKTALLAAAGVPVIVPLAFPKAPAIDSPDDALDVPLEALEHWELAPSNAAFLARAGVAFAFTADGLDKPEENFWKNVRLAVKRGLSAEQALAALTTTPARIAKASAMLGTLEPGKIANLVVADADLFTADEAKIELVFVDGRPYELDAFDAFDAQGRWQVSWPGGGAQWEIGKKADKLVLEISGRDFEARLDGDELVLFPPAAALGGGDGIARLQAYAHGRRFEGIAELPSGSSFGFEASFAGAAAEPGTGDADEDDVTDEGIPALGPQPYPAGAFGAVELPERPAVLLVRGATIWTSAAAGRLEHADLLVRDGRIAAIGSNLDAPRGAVIVDASGKHLTPGLVDAHSHTAISGPVNETGSAVTLEVRIRDVLNPTDIGIYRELAGGLTTANVLHGSANPMGGQNQIIKLRWGSDAAGLVFEGAPPGVKFALGENVKQSNWGDRFTTRYPQTRMGVEEIIRDTLVAARHYGELRRSSGRRDPPVRRNLRLDTALEILGGAREVHIHSYRQDEILAFVRLAQEFDLSVAAFQHVLEGYKVADAIAELGAGASTFSDWWAYKFEVWDAIPYNGALMHDAGVVVSFNSDDDELATRLNTEAAKAVKYGGLSEEEALAFVTRNPAIQLGIAERVGTLEPGKDADFVIWSGNPLSTFTRAEQTWIDGRKYFDLERDTELTETAAAERARIIQKILAERRRETENEDE